jgi:O-antigen ligase
MRERLSGAAPIWPVAAGLAVAVVLGILVAGDAWELAAAGVGLVLFLLAATLSPDRTALVVVALVPWSIYPAASGRFSLFAAVPIAGLVAVLLLLAEEGSPPRLARGMPVLAYGAFVAVAAAMAVLSTDPKTGLSRVLYLALFGLFARGLATALLTGRLSRRSLARAVVYGGALAAVAVTAQALYGIAAGQTSVTDWLNSVYPLFGGERAAGIATRNWYVQDVGAVRGVFPFMAAPSAGQYLALALVAAVWLRRVRDRTLATAGLDRIALALVLTGLVFTFSRQSWLGALAGLVALGLWSGGRRLLPVVAVGLLVVSILPTPGGSTTIGEYLLSSSDTSTTSSETRLGLWQQGIDLLPHHLLHGVGPGLYGTLNPDPSHPIYYAHNVFLDVGVELGALGLVALVFVVVLALRTARRRGSVLGFGMLVAWLVANLFDDVLYFPRNGLLVAVAFAFVAAGDRDAWTNDRAS